MSNNLDPNRMRAAASFLRSANLFPDVATWIEHRSRCVDRHKAMVGRRADKVASGLAPDGINPVKEALRQEGVAAFRDGLLQADNPYALTEKTERKYWDKGWRLASVFGQ